MFAAVLGAAANIPILPSNYGQEANLSQIDMRPFLTFFNIHIAYQSVFVYNVSITSIQEHRKGNYPWIQGFIP
jgi:hypothetical protein